MTTGNKRIMTSKGLKKLEDELFDLKVNKRKEVAQELKEAREQGDLSENAEYDAAKEKKSQIEARIVEIESRLKNVEVIDEDEISTDEVNIGATVKIYDNNFEEEMIYHIVGDSEADPLVNKISYESPVGMALANKKVGDTVEVQLGTITRSLKVLEISK